MAPLIVLVGAPGSGKSTVGQRVADELGVQFRDTDRDVELTTGSSIGDLFVDRGEAAFRALEHDAVSAALASHDGVLSLGGGSILDPETRTSLRDHRVVLLQVGLADAARRVGLNRDRPLLLGNVRAQLSALLEARAPLYVEVAKHVVVTDGRTPDQVAAEVVGLLAEQEPS